MHIIVEMFTTYIVPITAAWDFLGVKRIIMITITGGGKNKFGNTPLQSNKYNIIKMTKKNILSYNVYVKNKLYLLISLSFF